MNLFSAMQNCCFAKHFYSRAKINNSVFRLFSQVITLFFSCKLDVISTCKFFKDYLFVLIYSKFHSKSCDYRYETHWPGNSSEPSCVFQALPTKYMGEMTRKDTELLKYE